MSSFVYTATHNNKNHFSHKFKIELKKNKTKKVNESMRCSRHSYLWMMVIHLMIFLLKCSFHQWKIFILFNFERHYYLLVLATQKTFSSLTNVFDQRFKKKNKILYSFIPLGPQYVRTDNEVWGMGKEGRKEEGETETKYNTNTRVYFEKFLTYRSI